MDRESIVQKVTDIATELTHAEFGAFFYNVTDPDSGDAYMLYTFPSFSRTAQQRPLLMLTIPFVVYGIFRFLYQMHRNDKGGDPTADLLEDRALIICGLLWGLTAALIMVFGG